MENSAMSLYDNLNYYIENPPVPEAKDWLMTGSPLKVISIVAIYQLFCLYVGPWYMKDRKPFDLKNVIKIYNIIQIIVSLYLSYEGTNYIFFTDYNFKCQGLDGTDPAVALRIVKAVWLYYIIKIIDLMDTVFFVLRKSNRQITSLHIHHHSIMPLASWMTLTFFPIGQGILIGYINSIVHAVMYTYYLLAGLGNEYKKYLWWKKYLTLLQLVQFVIILVHGINSLFYTCSFPFFMKLLSIWYASFFLIKFGKFYYYNYVKSDKNKTK